MRSATSRFLEKIGRPRLLVVGDLILDEYLRGEADRISPEGPVAVLRVPPRGPAADRRLGGAANVANNLASLGAAIECVGVVGDDREGETVAGLLRSCGVGTRGVVSVGGRPTTHKQRILGQRDQQMLRVDREDPSDIDAATEEKLVGEIRRAIETADLVLVSDYAKGTVTARVAAAAIAAASERGVRVVVDPKGRDYSKYRGASAVTPNRAEAEAATGVPLGADAALEEAASRLIRDLRLEAAVITLGQDGIFARLRDGNVIRVPADARLVYDVSGAGDTVLAVVGLALAAGGDWETGIRLANCAAGIVVGRVGVATVTRAEVARSLEGRISLNSAPGGKILRPNELAARLAERRARGEKVVFTNGVFDLLHAGHVETLRFCRELGDCLVVGVNSDRSTRAQKGAGRPIQPEAERASILAALEAVDAVVVFDEATPEKTIEAVAPDVLVKGEDWAEKGVIGREFVESRGGRVVLAPMRPGVSSTSIIERVLERFGGKAGAG